MKYSCYGLETQILAGLKIPRKKVTQRKNSWSEIMVIWDKVFQKSDLLYEIHKLNTLTTNFPII